MMVHIREDCIPTSHFRFIGRKTLTVRQKTYDIHGCYRARVQHLLARLWSWRGMHDIWLWSHEDFSCSCHVHMCFPRGGWIFRVVTGKLNYHLDYHVHAVQKHPHCALASCLSLSNPSLNCPSMRNKARSNNRGIGMEWGSVRHCQAFSCCEKVFAQVLPPRLSSKV